mmetsp:Transcript_31377/g.73203  ORF Transcript_31377/g.73203 Transcript_31377/m.73203 type:complete len:250 (+) Transcript_31377:80-829(+)
MVDHRKHLWWSCLVTAALPHIALGSGDAAISLDSLDHIESENFEATDEAVPLCLLQTSVQLASIEGVASSKGQSLSVPSYDRAVTNLAQIDISNTTEDLGSLNESTIEAARNHVVKNKWILSLIELFGGGFLGIPRMYIGWSEPGKKNFWLGILQLCTFGGCGVWAAVDWIAFLVNSLRSMDSMNAVAISVDWSPETIAPARTIALFQLIVVCSLVSLLCCIGLFGAAAVAIAHTSRSVSKERSQSASA